MRARSTMVLLALLLPGCLPGDGARPRIGEPLADYAVPDLAGDTLALSSLRGSVVLVNLWATWCAPCKAETPYLQSLWEEHAADGLRIVGISMDTRDAADLVNRFVEEFGVTYDILHDGQMRGMDMYQVLGLPATFLLDRDGVLRWMRYGPILEGDPDFLAALEATLS